MSTHYVYELLDRDGKHLYIGCTNNIAARLTQHRNARDWFPSVTRIEVDAYPDQVSALTVERELIEQYRPQHNVVFTDEHSDRVSLAHECRRARREISHSRGWLCWNSCGPCVDLAHSRGVQCSRSACAVCPTFEDRWDYIEREQADITDAEVLAWIKAARDAA